MCRSDGPVGIAMYLRSCHSERRLNREFNGISVRSFILTGAPHQIVLIKQKSELWILRDVIWSEDQITEKNRGHRCPRFFFALKEALLPCPKRAAPAASRRGMPSLRQRTEDRGSFEGRPIKRDLSTPTKRNWLDPDCDCRSWRWPNSSTGIVPVIHRTKAMENPDA
jgi:hypothetical protein